eukprot:4378679-Prymnesium_polylepis.1
MDILMTERRSTTCSRTGRRDSESVAHPSLCRSRAPHWLLPHETRSPHATQAHALPRTMPPPSGQAAAGLACGELLRDRLVSMPRLPPPIPTHGAEQARFSCECDGPVRRLGSPLSCWYRVARCGGGWRCGGRGCAVARRRADFSNSADR